MALRFSQKSTVIISLISFLLLGSVAAFAIWYLGQDNQVAPDDSAAGICCNSFECEDGTPFGWDPDYQGTDCSERYSACDAHGGVAAGSDGEQCGGSAGCGGNGEACCQPGNGCASSLACEGGICQPSGGACSGTATCDNNGCYCNPSGNDCNPIFAQFHCLIDSPTQVPSSCNDANDDPEAQNRSVCKVIQYDVSQCNGTNANVVWIDEDGTRCSSNDGGLDVCLTHADFSLDGCQPQSCAVTQGLQCSDDGQVTINWTASPTGFAFGSDAGRVVVRINKLSDPWFTQGSDIWWSTHNSEFVNSGANPASASWTFDIDSNTDYDVRVSVDPSEEGATTEGLCTTAAVPFNCEANDTPTCNALTATSSSIQNGDSVTLTTSVADSDNNVSEVTLYWAESQANNNYCSSGGTTLWHEIGAATNSGGNSWSYQWNVSGIPSDGAIVVAANVEDNQGAWCTGNPSGSCSTTAASCTSCALTMGIDTPLCTGLAVTGGAVQNGESVTITMEVADDNGDIDSIPIYWTEVVANGNYCQSEDAWTLIGEATSIDDNTWTYQWNVTGIPNDGEIYISANPESATGTVFCTGNPSGSCGTSMLSCPTCNERVEINIPLCGGTCTTDDQCDGNMQCEGGMCRNPMCTNDADCECDIPVTGIFDSTQNKIIGGFVLIALSAAYMLFDGFDRIAVKIYNRASEFSLNEIVENKKVEKRAQKVENSRSNFEKKLQSKRK